MLAPPRSPSPVSLDARVTIPGGILFKNLSGETVLLNLNTGVYFGLDPTGTRIWQLLQLHPCPADILPLMLQEFDVTDAQCRSDVLTFVTDLHTHGLLQLSAPDA